MKQVLLYIFILLSTSTFSTAQLPDSLKYESPGPSDFHLAWLKTDPAMLIDVREPFECRKRIIKGSVNIPSTGNLDFAADTIDRNYALFIYCTSGYRSKRVAIFFYDKGFRKIYSLEGGIIAWKKDGFPVVKGKRKNANIKNTEK
jgi:thioredoxin 1